MCDFTWTHPGNGGVVGKYLAVGALEHLTLEAGLEVDAEGVEDTLGAGPLLVEAQSADPLAAVVDGSDPLDLVRAVEGRREVEPPVHPFEPGVEFAGRWMSKDGV